MISIYCVHVAGDEPSGPGSELQAWSGGFCVSASRDLQDQGPVSVPLSWQWQHIQASTCVTSGNICLAKASLWGKETTSLPPNLR